MSSPRFVTTLVNALTAAALVVSLAGAGRVMASTTTPDQAALAAKVKRINPNVTIDRIQPAGYGGLFEVVAGGELLYTDAHASFLLRGSLYDLASGEAVSERRLNQLNAVRFEDLPLEKAIKIVRGDGSRRLAVFEDPNCGYCKRFERDLLAVDNVTVYVFLYPILSSESRDKSAAIWCAPDRAKAWLDYMARDLPAPAAAPTTCMTPLADNLAFGASKRVRGTPTIIFSSGERTPGALRAPDLERRLAEVASGGKAAAR